MMIFVAHSIKLKWLNKIIVISYQRLATQWPNMIFSILIIGCVECLMFESNGWYWNSHCIFGILRYYTLKCIMYIHSELLNFIRLMYILLHFLKKVWNDFRDFPFEYEWTRTPFWVLNILLIFGIFHSLNKDKDSACESRHHSQGFCL